VIFDDLINSILFFSLFYYFMFVLFRLIEIFLDSLTRENCNASFGDSVFLKHASSSPLEIDATTITIQNLTQLSPTMSEKDELLNTLVSQQIGIKNNE